MPEVLILNLNIILAIFLFLCFYLPFAVVSFHIASSPYSQCLSVLIMLYETIFNGRIDHGRKLVYVSITIRSMCFAIGMTHLALIGYFFLNICVKKWVNSCCFNVLIQILLLLIAIFKPAVCLIAVGFDIFGSTALSNDCPPSISTFFIIFMVANLLEYGMWVLMKPLTIINSF